MILIEITKLIQAEKTPSLNNLALSTKYRHKDRHVYDQD